MPTECLQFTTEVVLTNINPSFQLADFIFQVIPKFKKNSVYKIFISSNINELDT